MFSQNNKTVEKIWPPEKLMVMDICHQVHKRAEEFYLYLAGMHRKHREIARMWGLLAIDKCNHADTFKMAHRLKGGGIREINVSADVAAGILAAMKKIPMDDHRPPPAVLEALRFTVKMEENLLKVHFSNVVKFASEQDSALMASSLKSGSSILHMITEEYMNMTVVG